MGVLDTILIAGLTASMISKNDKSEDLQDINLLLGEKSIILSSEKSRLGKLRLSNIRKENFESYDRNILQITKKKAGLASKYPLHIIEYLTDNDIEEVMILPNYNCYQKQFKNSKFCVLSFDEIDNSKNYNVVKIHTDPIETSKEGEELFLCEVISTSVN